MYIDINQNKPLGIEGFAFLEKETTYGGDARKHAKISLPDSDNIFAIMSPRYDTETSGVEYDKSYFQYQDIDQLIKCLQHLKAHVESN